MNIFVRAKELLNNFSDNIFYWNSFKLPFYVDFTSPECCSYANNSCNIDLYMCYCRLLLLNKFSIDYFQVFVSCFISKNNFIHCFSFSSIYFIISLINKSENKFWNIYNGVIREWKQLKLNNFNIQLFDIHESVKCCVVSEDSLIFNITL